MYLGKMVDLYVTLLYVALLILLGKEPKLILLSKEPDLKIVV